MQRFLLIVTFLYLIVGDAFSQVYSGKKSGMFFFVDVNENVAHVEIFSSDDPAYVTKKLNGEFLKPIHAGDTVFTGKENHLLKKGNKYRLVHTLWPEGKIYGIKLKPCVNDSRTVLRDSPYNSEMTSDERPVVNVPDSNAKVTYRASAISQEEIILHESHLSDSVYISKAGIPGDTLNTIHLTKDTLLLHFALSPAALHNLISNVRRNDPAFKGNDFMHEALAERSNYLMGYSENEPLNKPDLLNAIRAYGYKESLLKVKELSNSYVQKALLVPAHKGKIGDRLMVTLVALLIATEIAAIASLAYWIFKSNSLSF